MRTRPLNGSFEGARGVAALMVALYHFSLFSPPGLHYPSAVRYGYLFVDLFFVLSGYVICSAYADRFDEAGGLRTFLIRRFGRLFPLLIFSTFAYELVPNLHALAKYLLVRLGRAHLFAAPDSFSYTLPSPAEALTTLTMTHGLGMFDKAILNFTSWSISTEFYTYLAFAAICVVCTWRTRTAVFGALAAGAFALTCWASIVLHRCIDEGDCLNVTYDFGFMRCMASFFLGCLTCRLAQRVEIGRAHVSVNQLGAFAAVAGLVSLVGHAPLVAFAGPAVFAALILSLSTDRGCVAWLLNTRPAQLLGERSYSIYLMHPVMLEVWGLGIRHPLSHVANVGVLLGYVVTVIVASGFTYRFVEAPGREFFNRVARGRQVLGGPSRTA